MIIKQNGNSYIIYLIKITTKHKTLQHKMFLHDLECRGIVVCGQLAAFFLVLNYLESLFLT